MRKNNICKFIMAEAEGRLVVRRFVFEKDCAQTAEPQRLPSHTVYLVAEGSGTMSFDGRREEVSIGSLVFGFQGEMLEAQGENLAYLYICFEGARSEELFSRFGIAPFSRNFSDFQPLVPFWQDNLVRAGEGNLDLVAESVLIYTFSRLVKAEKPAEDVVNRLIKYTEGNFSDPNLSLAQLAIEWGYHVKYLSHRFKEYMGVGFARYLRNLRVKHAVFLFDHGVYAVKNVAFLCGFSDPLYFSKVFKETVGVSPKEYAARGEN
jgi:AraC-like DNA-binding protein